jgi:hypothetical protein
MVIAGCWASDAGVAPQTTFEYQATPNRLAIYVQTANGVRIDSFTKQ